jgi:nucleotide-binding universal stress UspA family protein
MYDHVLVGTDGSPTATKAVEAAARLAQVHCAQLTIVHAFDPRPLMPASDGGVGAEYTWRQSVGAMAEALVNAAADHAQAVTCGGLQVEARAEPGDPVTVLLTFVRKLRPDAVVVGNADLHRFRLRRSIGHALSRRVHSDVVIVDTVGLAGKTGERRSVA